MVSKFCDNFCIIGGFVQSSVFSSVLVVAKDWNLNKNNKNNPHK